MCGRLDCYLMSFSRLRVDKNKKSWSSSTNHCSPYKPFLLLAILDQIASGQITREFIEPNFDLTATFQSYIVLLPATSRKASMSYPFYHLESSDFWKLVPQPGTTHRKGLAISSMKKLQELYLGARIAKDLFMLLQMGHTRAKLREVIIKSYFASEIQGTIMEQSLLNCASSQYSFRLMETAETQPDYAPQIEEPAKREKVRDQGFRKAIVRLYAHRCALCGIKMLTPEGHTVVDAAHIKPWSKSHNDHPTNGMALCKLCHWSFDEGLMSVDDTFRVLISSEVKNDPNLPGHILTLSERSMFRPPESRYWPDQENFSWHRKERYRR